MNKLKSFLVMFLMAWGVYSAEGEMDFIKGADVSMLKQLEDNGAKFLAMFQLAVGLHNHCLK